MRFSPCTSPPQYLSAATPARAHSSPSTGVPSRTELSSLTQLLLVSPAYCISWLWDRCPLLSTALSLRLSKLSRSSPARSHQSSITLAADGLLLSKVIGGADEEERNGRSEYRIVFSLISSTNLCSHAAKIPIPPACGKWACSSRHDVQLFLTCCDATSAPLCIAAICTSNLPLLLYTRQA